MGWINKEQDCSDYNDCHGIVKISHQNFDLLLRRRNKKEINMRIQKKKREY